MAGSLTDWIEGSVAIALKNQDPGGKSLHRETKTIKLDGTKIVSDKLSNRYKIFYDIWNN